MSEKTSTHGCISSIPFINCQLFCTFTVYKHTLVHHVGKKERLPRVQNFALKIVWILLYIPIHEDAASFSGTGGRVGIPQLDVLHTPTTRATPRVIAPRPALLLIASGYCTQYTSWLALSNLVQDEGVRG